MSHARRRSAGPKLSDTIRSKHRLPRWGAALLLFGALVVSTAAVPEPLAEEGVKFVDIAESAGLKFEFISGDPARKYIFESTLGGCAFIDFDGDGWLDIYLLNGSTLKEGAIADDTSSALFRNNRNGTFTDVSARAGVENRRWGSGVSAGDYDNDGKIDLHVTNFEGPNRLYRNNGDGTFTDRAPAAGIAATGYSTGSVFFDYDRDGSLDLYVLNYVVLDLKDLPVPGSNILCKYRGIPVACGPRGLTPGKNILYRNNGDGTFLDVTQQAGAAVPRNYYSLGVTSADFNDDGWPDLFVANDSTPNYLFKNNGNGTFAEIALRAGVAYNEDGREQAGMGVDFGDYDNDGGLDLFVTNFSDDHNTLYRNLGKDAFADVSYAAGIAEVSWNFLGWGTKFFDFDHDGWRDLFVANGHVYPDVDRYQFGTRYRQTGLLYRNLGNGKFEDWTSRGGPGLTTPRCSRGAAFGDFDNDGDIDILVNNLGERPSLLRNDGGNRKSWIQVLLEGTKSNRSAIGARVRFKTSAGIQVDEVHSGASFCSQNDVRLHFGLNGETTAGPVEVRWPSGALEVIPKLEVNRLTVVREGSGVVR